jgi:hypothetical protein
MCDVNMKPMYRCGAKFCSYCPVQLILQTALKFTKLILYICVYQTRCNVTGFILSGNCFTYFGWYHHPSSGPHTTVIYSIWYLSHICCYLPLSWKGWNWFECAVGGVRHPQHTHSDTPSIISSLKLH